MTTKMKKRTHEETHELVASIMEEQVPDPEGALLQFIITGSMPDNASPARQFAEDSGLDLDALEDEAKHMIVTARSVSALTGVRPVESIAVALMSAMQLGWDLHKRCSFDHEHNPPE